VSTDRGRFGAGDGQLRDAVRARAVVLRAIRQFFDRRGFLEVDPPQVATSPGLEVHLDAMRVDLRAGMGGRPVVRYLTTSPEYYCKRLLSAGFERIYALQHAFRSGESGAHHNPEFMMLEWYRAGAGWRHIAADVRALLGHCASALRAAGFDGACGERSRYDPQQPWTRLGVRAALRRWAGFDPIGPPDRVLARARRAGVEVRAGDTVADVLVQALVERVEPRLRDLPVVVLAPWPAVLASLARPVPGRPELAERFEVYLRGVELANGFGELTDAGEQRRRFEQDLADRQRLGKPAYPMDERFLAALADGMPPASGVALGVDRMLMALLGLGNVRGVMAFPFDQA